MKTIPEAEVSSWILQRLESKSTGRCVVHGGHFVLDSNGESVTDNLEPEEVEHEVLQGFVDFTRDSWSLACEVAHRCSEASLLVMVNDWQFIRARSGVDRRTAERQAQAMREVYYERISTLPSYHLEALAEAQLGKDRIFPWTEQQWLFSESALRHSLARSLKGVFSSGEGEKRGLWEEFTPAGDPVIKAKSELYGETCLLFCGSTNCSGEIVELLRELYEREVRTFVNIYPKPCLGPVTAGTVLGKQIFELRGFRIINVALPLGHLDSSPDGRIMVEESIF